jgi:hypothetical protein
VCLLRCLSCVPYTGYLDDVGHRVALREFPTGVTNLSSRFDKRGASELQPRERSLQSQLWRDAMTAAKLAMCAYASDPSSRNAAEVELAWQRVRRLQRVVEWRRPSTGRAPSPSAPVRREALTGPR